MGIFLKGAEMPDEKEDYLAVVIYGDGTVRTIHGNIIKGTTAIHVRAPHGPLKDAEALDKELLAEQCRTAYSEVYSIGINDGIGLAQECLENAPTVIEAEEVSNG